MQTPQPLIMEEEDHQLSESSSQLVMGNYGPSEQPQYNYHIPFTITRGSINKSPE
jgi:hypothetical protein